MPDTQNKDLLAFGSVVLNGEFVVHNLRLVVADSGIVVAMPNEEYRGEYRDIAHPITSQCRQKIRMAFIRAYNEECPRGKEIELSEKAS